jgi:alpha-tubulin suppressor-like RCC1 family protein
VGVSGLSAGVSGIAAGAEHSCAVMDTGHVKCWGSNYSGQLGDGTGISSPDHPVDVVGLTSGVASVYAGDHATCAITDESVAKCWGDNALGQLGNGEIGYATIPQDVVGSPFGERIFADGFD